MQCNIPFSPSLSVRGTITIIMYCEVLSTDLPLRGRPNLLYLYVEDSHGSPMLNSRRRSSILVEDRLSVVPLFVGPGVYDVDVY